VSGMLATTICPKTPRDRNASKEEKQRLKAESDASYKVDARQFNAVLKEFAERAGHLAKLNQQFGAMKVSKGVTLEADYKVEGDNRTYRATLTRKELKAANSAFQQEIRCLKHYFRMSKKKAREKAQPSSLKGTYTPVYAAPALQRFLTAAPERFGYVDPSNAGSGLLMDQLPYAQQGFMLRNSTTMLFFIYAHVNNLQFQPGNLADGTKVDASWTRSDDVMNDAFGGNIPAAFYRDPAKQKSTVVAAQARGEPVGQNTYDPIEAQNAVHYAKDQSPDGKEKFVFRREAFKTFFFQNIAGANYYSRNNLEAAVNAGNGELATPLAGLNDPTYQQAMLNEHDIIKGTSERWGQILEPERKQNREARKRRTDAERKAQRAAGAR